MRMAREAVSYTTSDLDGIGPPIHRAFKDCRIPAALITSPSSAALDGVSSDGFTTTVLPQASAGLSFQVVRSSGRFHGQMTAITPFGPRTT